MADGTSPDLKSVFESTVRRSYQQIITISILGILSILTSIPLITAGNSAIALVHTISKVLNTRKPKKEWDWASQYLQVFKSNLYLGIICSFILILPLLSTIAYLIIATQLERYYIFGSFLGLYAITFALWGVLRTASIINHISSEKTGMIDFFNVILKDIINYPYYTILHLTSIAILLIIAIIVPITIPLTAAGIPATLEVIMFEELTEIRAYEFVQ